MPPFSRMTSSMPPDSIVTIIRSPIPAMPVPMLPSHVVHVNVPWQKPIIAFTPMPMANTSMTLTPDIASPMTRTYGIRRVQLTGSAGALKLAP